MKRQFVIGNILLLLLLLNGCAEKRQEAEEVQVSEENTGITQVLEEDTGIVQVLSGTSCGSGIVYEITEQDLVVLTAGHVLSAEEATVELVFGDNVHVQGEKCLISDMADIAFVTVKRSDIPKEQQLMYQSASVDKEKFDALRAGTKLYLSGFSEETKVGILRESWIYVEDFGQYMMLLDGVIVPGMSGGGVFDEAGNLMGILCGGNESGETVAVPLSVILAVYELL